MLKRICSYALFFVLFNGIISFCLPASAQKTNSTTPEPSLIIYNFNNTIITFQNEFLIDSSIKITPAYIHSPFGERKISVSGPNLKIKIFDKKWFENRKSFSYNSLCIDSSNSDKPLFDLLQLEARFTLDGQVIKDWTPVLQHKNNEEGNEKVYYLYTDSMSIESRLLLEFKNKSLEEPLIRFNIFRQANPLNARQKWI